MRRSSFSTPRAARWAWTLAELMIAMSITSLMTAGLIAGAITIQRSFVASRHHVESQAQQMRLMDFMTLDLRRALTVDAGDGVLTLTIPDYYGTDGEPRDPHISGGQALYGPTPTTISYYQTGASIYRSEGTRIITLADNVAEFQLEFLDAGQSIQVEVTFLPKFQFAGRNTNSVRVGTAIYSNTLLRNKRQY